MFKKANFDKFVAQENLGASTYLGSYVDFLKWSTALALAALAWMSLSGNFIFHTTTLVSVVAIAASLVLAILALRSALGSSGYQWDLLALHRSSSLLDLFKASMANEELIAAKEDELKDEFLELEAKGSRFRNSTWLNNLLTWHVTLLALGVLLAAIEGMLPVF